MANLKNVRIWIMQDLLTQLREKYPKETKPMTNDTMINWFISNKVLLEEEA